jgi:hypothetical protein
MSESSLGESQPREMLGKSLFPRENRGFPFSEDSSQPQRTQRVEDSIHGRSVSFPESGSAIWADEFGNVMLERNVKGFPHKAPYLQLDHNYSEGFRVNGLMSSSYLPRVRKASSYMRSHGLPTERIIHAREIKIVPSMGKYISVEEWKESAVVNWPEEFRQREKESPGFLRSVEARLREETFVVVERDLPLGERLQDLRSLTPETAPDFFRKVFLYYNQAISREARRSPGIELSAESADDQEKYLEEILPRRMGGYLAKFHSLGLYHHYPTGHNWTMAGCLVDLDSVGGSAIFKEDPPLTREAIGDDIGTTLSYICDTIGRALVRLFPERKGPFADDVNFVTGYLEEHSRSNHLLARLLGKNRNIRAIFEEIEVRDPFLGVFMASGRDILAEAQKELAKK